MKKLFVSVAMLLPLLLVACGGGGDTTTPVTTPTTPSGPPTLTLTLIDAASKATKSSISSGSSALAVATIKNADGTLVNGALVTFKITDTALAVMMPTSGIRLTEAGEAKVQIDAASFSSDSATTITATATVPNGTSTIDLNGSINFSIKPASVSLSGLAANLSGATSLSPYATTNVTVTVLVGGVAATMPVAVTFSSSCATSGKASLTSNATTAQGGVATAIYKDLGCASIDTITASIQAFAQSQSIGLSVSAPSTDPIIQFELPTQSSLVLKGNGGGIGVEDSIIKFKLVDSPSNSQPIKRVNVDVDLSSREGGILLDGSSAGKVTRQTDDQGDVSVTVSSGTLPTSFKVIASYKGGKNYYSEPIAIAVGRPAQSSFSLSTATTHIEGLTTDGITTTVGVIASDRLSNPVPAGTIINFIASGGQIGTDSNGVCATNSKGACSVVFTSANSRPINGRVAILAYTKGEEDFSDANRNNIYDVGEPFTDLGDIYVDGNFNGGLVAGGDVPDAGEKGIAFVTSGPVACTNAIPGVLSIPLMVKNTCDGYWGQAHVRQSVVIVLSGSTARLVSPSTVIPLGACANISLPLRIDDGNGNALPAGTKLAIVNSKLNASNAGVVGNVADVPTISPSDVGDSNSLGPTSHTLRLGVKDTVGCTYTDQTTGVTTLTTWGKSSFDLEATTPAGKKSLISFTSAP